MENTDALDTLSALAHDTRLAVFRALVRAGTEGMAAGEIAAALDVRPNTLSNNLTILGHAGLVSSRREGRSIRYFAVIERMAGLVDFLLRDCCGGQADRCAPLAGRFARGTTEPMGT